jgi:hypothetical protein
MIKLYKQLTSYTHGKTDKKLVVEFKSSEPIKKEDVIKWIQEKDSGTNILLLDGVGHVNIDNTKNVYPQR